MCTLNSKCFKIILIFFIMFTVFLKILIIETWVKKVILFLGKREKQIFYFWAKIERSFFGKHGYVHRDILLNAALNQLFLF